MKIIGGLEDQLTSLVWANISNKPFNISDPALHAFTPYQQLFHSFIDPFSSTQPILWGFLSLGLSFVGIDFYNFFIGITMFLNFYVSYIFFKKFPFSGMLALIFTFSSYFWSHLGTHPDLMQIWLVPLFFIFHSRYSAIQNKKEAIKLASIMIFSFLVSTYLGLFLFIYFSLHTFFSLIFFKKRFYITHYIIVVAIITAILGYLYYDFLSPDYNDTTPIANIERNYEDFFYFSSRPWYFLIPSQKNPMLSGVSNYFLDISDKSSYFLADDYFANEHAPNFYGFTFWVILIFLLVQLVRKNLLFTENKNILMLILTSIGLVSLMMPPFFTVSGIKIYTPGQLMWLVFPMFRVTARISVLVHFIFIYIIGLSFKSLLIDKATNIKRGILAILFVVIILETYIPVKISNFPIAPDYIQHFEVSGKSERLLVLPEYRVDESLLWLHSHKQLIVNIELHTDIDLIQKNQFDYLVIYNDYISETNLDGLNLVETYTNESIYAKK